MEHLSISSIDKHQADTGAFRGCAFAAGELACHLSFALPLRVALQDDFASLAFGIRLSSFIPLWLELI